MLNFVIIESSGGVQKIQEFLGCTHCDGCGVRQPMKQGRKISYRYDWGACVADPDKPLQNGDVQFYDGWESR